MHYSRISVRSLSIAAFMVLAGCSSNAAEDDGETAEGAVVGVDDPTVAVPGTTSVKTCGEGATAMPRLSAQKVNDLIRKNEKLSRVIDQQTGLTLVSLTGGSEDPNRVATWAPSKTVFGEWSPREPLMEQVGFTAYKPCLSCVGGQAQPYTAYMSEKLDRAEILALWDARNEKLVSLNFIAHDQGQVGVPMSRVIEDMKIGADHQLAPPDAGGVFTLNCKVDGSGSVTCPQTTWSNGGAKSFHNLQFKGRVTDKCVLITSKNLDATGKAPAEGVVGVAIGAKLDLGL